MERLGNISLAAMLAAPVWSLLSVVLLPLTADASLLIPEETEFELTAIGEGDGSSTSSADQSNDHPLPPRDAEQLFRIELSLVNGILPTGGSTSGGSSSAGASAGGAACIAAGGTSIPEDANVSWLAGERQLSIPDPPGSGLMRPPQHCCNISISN